jgi:hypothetical protein
MSGTGFPSGAGLGDPAAWDTPVQPGVPDTRQVPAERVPHQPDTWTVDADGFRPDLCTVCGTPVRYGSRHSQCAPGWVAPGPAEPTDTQMLDWVLRHRAALMESTCGPIRGMTHMLFFTRDGIMHGPDAASPRDAIAAAMKEHP